MAASKRPRGRPRSYDPELALRQALDAFWTQGYSATSLDDLGAAMGMNRPSLYAAFGDKQALYLKALESYWDQALVAMRALLSRDEPLAQALMRIYDAALSLYFPPSGAPRGCFGISTAAVEAVTAPAIRAAFEGGLRRIDKEFEHRFARAVELGELPAAANPRTLAEIASALLHTLAIRSRYGASRKELRRLAERAVMHMLQA
ncbi:MAG TPA: TetR/AcrR family transcriptional regulator [Hyphomicrobiaceae bacterium]|nr:TetR/AcrR family transcriptional regulator [Hyphomicrobiaceae bacterium]